MQTTKAWQQLRQIAWLDNRSGNAAYLEETRFFGRDYSLVFVATEPGRLAALETGVIDAAMLSVPENILARQKGFTELALSADFLDFPQNGFGTSNRKIKENPTKSSAGFAPRCVG
jgi:hypothetical protein